MHTPEEARQLWCPMSRVAQSGHSDVDTAYNRVLTKHVVPVRLKEVRSPEDFELGQDPEKAEVRTMLTTDQHTSSAARCVAEECAMWRWEHTTQSVPAQGPNGATVYEQRATRTHGYCGLAGKPYAP